MLNNRSLAIGLFILTGLGGLIGLIFSLSLLDFDSGGSFKVAIIVLFSIVYLLAIAVIILFLKVYEKGKITKEIKEERSLGVEE